MVSPTKNVTLYSIGIEQSYLTSDEKGDSKNDESFSIPTSDGKTVRVKELELANIEAQTAKIEAQKEREVAVIQAEKEKEAAEIEAQTALVKANADADVVRIAAEAEAEANRVIAASLTPELIEKIRYEQWDGQVPKVTGGTSIVSIDGMN